MAFAPDPEGRRRSSAATQAVFVDALGALSPDAAARAAAETRWHARYPTHVSALMRASIAPGPQAAVAAARAGLDSLHSRTEFVRNGRATALASLGRVERTGALGTATLRGEGDPAPKPLAIPYKDEMLSGRRLARQLEHWERMGIIEPSHAHALREVAAHPEWLDLSDQSFALLGASAEVGPLASLAGWRARIVAVDLPGERPWKRIEKLVRRGNATLLAPVRTGSSRASRREDERGVDDPGAEGAAQATAGTGTASALEGAGANLLTDLPELLDWLGTLDGPLTVGAYAYLDGARHVRVAAAMDVVMATLARSRREVSLAALCTPTDVYAVPAAAAEASRAAWSTRSLANRLWQEPLSWLSAGRFFRPNYPAARPGTNTAHYGLCDSLVLQQGANYALAKRVQQWRALVERDSGVRVSINVAPSTTTWSVIKNPALRAAFAGAHHFGVEAFDAATTSALMAALLVYDLRSGDSPSNPDVPLAHPLELLMHGANHGGMWRMPFAARSALPFAALLGWPRRSKI